MGINAGVNPYNFANNMGPNYVYPTQQGMPTNRAAYAPTSAPKSANVLPNYAGTLGGPIANFARATGYAPGGGLMGGALQNAARRYTPTAAMKIRGTPLQAMTATMPMQQQANQLMNFRQPSAGGLNAMLGQANPWMRGQVPQSVMAPPSEPALYNPLAHLPFYA